MKLFVSTFISILFAFIFFLFLQGSFSTGRSETSKPLFLTYFLIDGLSKSVFEAEIRKNNLPNIQSLMDRGVYIANGISSFPSMTGYGFYPFLTGVDATKSGILGLRWFDRSLNFGNLRNYVGRTHIHMNQDILSRKTIFEYFPDQFTVSINSYMNRGAKKQIMTGWSHFSAKFQNSWIFKRLNAIPLIGPSIAPNIFETEALVMDYALEDLERIPKIHWITFTSLDAYHHMNGMDHNYVKLLRFIDSLIGKYLQKNKELGQEDSRIYALISDHGVRDVHKNLDLADHFMKKFDLRFSMGNSINFLGSGLNTPLEDVEETDGFIALNGNLMSFLYLKDTYKPYPQNWRGRLPYQTLRKYPLNLQMKRSEKGKRNKYIDLVHEITQIKGIEFVIYQKSKHEVVVHQKGGVGMIRGNGRGYRYSYKRKDPLGYSMHKKTARLINGYFHSSRKWLEASFDSEYPDAIHRVFKLLQHPKSGDVVIVASKGYDMGNNYELIVKNFRGGHGGLHAENLRVPYIIAGKNIKKKRIEFARAEDIGRYLLNLMLKPIITEP